jgi:hypothetical protein
MLHVWETDVNTGFWCGDLRERNNLKDLDLDKRVILKLIFKNSDGVWTGLIWLRIGRGKCGNEISGSI